jgi:hypothetical protein
LTTLEFLMQRLSHLAVAAAAITLMSLPTTASFGQNAQGTGTDTITAPPPATTPASPPATAAPAATTTTPAATPPADATPEAKPSGDTPPAKTTEPTPKAKKKSVSKASRQEIDRSIDNGTVPSRYRKSVPKEYQQYIPFEK